MCQRMNSSCKIWLRDARPGIGPQKAPVQRFWARI
jgi:hypothetical protein